MKTTQIPIIFGLLLNAALIQAQTPSIVSAVKVGTSDKVRVTFNVPVTPAGATNALADNFSGASVDPTRWRSNGIPFEPDGTTVETSSIIQEDGELIIDLEVESPDWAGISLATVNSFSASASQPLFFEVDRVAHDEDASDSRTGVWITDATRSHYVFFADNEGDGGWQYNRLIGDTGDNPILRGAVAPLVNGEVDGIDFNDLDTHRIKAVLDGTTVRLYLDDQFATEIPFPFASGIVFEFGAYAALQGDLVTGVFDNARVARLVPVTLSSFLINNGGAVTGVTVTSDPKVLELTTTGVTAGSPYTLTISGVRSSDETLIAPNSAVPIQTGTVNGTANTNYATAVLADHPVAYYQMDQINGTSVPNLGSSGTPAVYLPGPHSHLTQGPGLPDFPGFAPGNSAALFDGIGTYTDDDDEVQLEGVGPYIDTESLLLTDLPTFSIEAWIRPGNLDEIRLGILGTFCMEFGFNDPGTIHMFTCDGGIIYAAYPFDFNEWHHIVVTGDGTNLTMYADGTVLARVEEETDNYGGEDRNVYIGGGGIFDEVESEGFGNWWPGGIDEVAIYTNALSEARVQAHFGAAFAAQLRPTITITNPVENAVIAAGATVTIGVQTSAPAGRTVTRVEFSDRFTDLGESTSSPFSVTIPSITEGRHSFTAKAYDDLGVWTISEPVEITVGTPKPLLVMVVGSVDLEEDDEAVQEHLIDLGYDVQLVPANRLSAEDVTDASLVVVPVVGIDSVAEILRELAVPILTWDLELQPTFLFTEDEIDYFWGETFPVAFINIVNADHPLAAGLPEGITQVYEFGQEFGWGVPGEEAIVIATAVDEETQRVLYAYDVGATLIDDSEAPERRVFFMITEGNFLTLTDDGRRLFDAAVAWAAIPRFLPPFIQGGDIILSWVGAGTLQSADTVDGVWTDIPDATSPHSVPATGPSKFFRIER